MNKELDSKNIYIAVNHMLHKIELEWSESNDNEWYFVGEIEDFKTQLVQDNISHHFEKESELYLMIDRNTSAIIAIENAVKEILKAKQNQIHSNIVLCNKTLNTFMQFNTMGTARHGKIEG